MDFAKIGKKTELFFFRLRLRQGIHKRWIVSLDKNGAVAIVQIEQSYAIE